MLNYSADLDAGLAELRGYALQRMKSRVTIRRRAGKTTTSAGVEVPNWVTVAADVPFRSDGTSSSSGGSTGARIGGVTFEEAIAVGHLPHDYADLHDGDLLECTSGEWAGSVWRVIKAIRADQKTARRLPLADEARPKEW